MSRLVLLAPAAFALVGLQAVYCWEMYHHGPSGLGHRPSPLVRSGPLAALAGGLAGGVIAAVCRTRPNAVPVLRAVTLVAVGAAFGARAGYFHGAMGARGMLFGANFGAALGTAVGLAIPLLRHGTGAPRDRTGDIRWESAAAGVALVVFWASPWFGRIDKASPHPENVLYSLPVLVLCPAFAVSALRRPQPWSSSKRFAVLVLLGWAGRWLLEASPIQKVREC